jgi:histone acetyltransferase MYST1
LLLPAAQVGTPERPLSDLGRVSYRSYWTRVLMPVLKERQGSVAIKELSELTCIKPDDIIYTLQHLGLVQYQKGQHVLLADPKLLDQHLREAGSWGLQVRSHTAAAKAAAAPSLGQPRGRGHTVAAWSSS